MLASRTGHDLVWLTERDDNPADSADAIASWLDAMPSRRAIVVTWRPAPVFGWQISDALRTIEDGDREPA